MNQFSVTATGFSARAANLPLRRPSLAVFGLLLALAVVFASLPDRADARSKFCFGKKINRVVKGKNKTVRVAFKDVTWIAGDRITVIGKPYSHICADRGRQTVRAGKGLSKTSTGADNDRIILHHSSNLNIAQAGTGNDFIRGSKGHDFLYGGPKSNPRGLPDRDTIFGMGGNDRIFDYSGEGNRLYGVTGSDRIFSIRNAVSSVFGGNGSDFIYSDGGTSSNGQLEKLFGERGNDRLNGNRGTSDGPVFLDGGSGDDWLNGTSFDDTVIFHSGIVKVNTGGGDDLVIGTSAGRVSLDGGPGRDTMSYATHTPSKIRGGVGVKVDLATGKVGGVGAQTVRDVEVLIGSSFADEITAKPGVENVIEGGLGDDLLVGQGRDGDFADGGLGENTCEGFRKDQNCNRNSPGDSSGNRVLVDINESGVLTVMGSRGADDISVGYDQSIGGYKVDPGGATLVSGLCDALSQGGGVVTCPARFNNLNGVLVYGDDGADRIKILNSVPAFVTTTINGGSGKNVLIGGKSKDVISTEGGSHGSVIRGNGNYDQIYVPDGGTAIGGGASDVIHSQTPCDGGVVKGGKGNDNLVFTGSARGVKADLARGYARYRSGRCAHQLKIRNDVESLEGTKYNDSLRLGPRSRAQGIKRSLLGREGHDVLDAKNGVRDTVTTGGGGRGNKVIADSKDKVHWGWGLSGY